MSDKKVYKWIRGMALVFVLMFSMIWVMDIPVFADEISELQKKQEMLKRQAEQAGKQIKDAKEQQKETVAVINSLDKELNKTQADIDRLEDNITKLNGQIKDAQAEIDTCQKNYNNKREQLKKRMRAMYMQSDISYLDVICRAESFTDVLVRVKMIGTIFSYDNALMDDIRKEKMDILYKKTEIESTKAKREVEMSQRVERSAVLDKTKNQKQDYMKKLEADINQLEAMEEKMLENSKKIGNEIKSLLDKKRKYAGGPMVWPVPSVGTDNITSLFGMRFHPILKRNRMHTGVDIGAASGTKIVAASSGKVIKADYDADGYGNYVVLDHGVKDKVSISTLYAHCSKLLVKTGDEVKAGQVVGLMGSTGLSTGPHLHFEVRLDNQTVDPKPYLGY